MDPLPSKPSLLGFGIFKVDLKVGELRKAGIKQKLAPQPFQVLQALLERPGEVVTREQLRDLLWPDHTFVDYDLALKKGINRLREVLGDSADSPRFIETIHRQGYRFLAQVQRIESPQASSALKSQVPWKLAVGLSCAIAAVLLFAFNVGKLRTRIFAYSRPPEIRSIAVLPLENLSHDPNQEYFVDGMTDALITDLAQIRSLKVISRTSSMQYKQLKKPLPEIARELNVDGIVEGTVQRSGDRVRITGQLIDATHDRHLWAASYERDLKDILALQDEVARDIAGEIRVTLQPEEASRLTHARAVDPDVYESYLKGRYFFERWNADGRRKALDYFRQAVARDPGFPPAYSGLADTLEMRSYFNESMGPEERTNAIAAAQEALRLDNSFADAHASLGMASMIDLHWADAERELRSALSLNPNCPICHLWYAYYLTFTSRFTGAAEEMKKTQTLDPLSSLTYVASGVMRYFSRDFNEAKRQYQKAIELDPANPEAYKNLADVYLEEQMCSEATSQFVRAEQLLGQSQNASALTKAFRISGCRGMLSKQLEFYSDPANPDYYPMYAAANAALLGKKEEAFNFLEKAYDTRQSIIELPVEPELDNIRSDPRYQDLLRRIGLPSEMSRGKPRT